MIRDWANLILMGSLMIFNLYVYFIKIQSLWITNIIKACSYINHLLHLQLRATDTQACDYLLTEATWYGNQIFRICKIGLISY